jgi:hypothetical protein
MKKMSDLRREQMVTTEEKLLFDILQELKEINQKLQSKPVRPVRKATEAKGYPCKYCGEPFENRHKMASHVGKCPKKPKKEGAKK